MTLLTRVVRIHFMEYVLSECLQWLIVEVLRWKMIVMKSISTNIRTETKKNDWLLFIMVFVRFWVFFSFFIYKQVWRIRLLFIFLFCQSRFKVNTHFAWLPYSIFWYYEYELKFPNLFLLKFQIFTLKIGYQGKFHAFTLCQTWYERICSLSYFHANSQLINLVSKWKVCKIHWFQILN